MVFAAWLLNAGNQRPGEPADDVSSAEDHVSGHSVWRGDRPVLMVERFDPLSVQTSQERDHDGKRTS